MTMALSQPLKWHGGKAYLASKIVALMPPRCKNPNKPDDDDPGWLHYVEPYFGGGAVLLANDPDGISEVVNDMNEHLINFWEVLAHVPKFERFLRIAQVTPFAEQCYRKASAQLHDLSDDPVLAAWSFFVRCRQSLAGRMQSFTGITKTRTRRGMNNEVSAWLTCIEGLPAVNERLKRVLILNDDAIDVIRKHDGPRTPFYLDPTYLHETRATTGEYGEYEMTSEQHGNLLEVLSLLTGRFLLSGYRSDLYDDWAAACKWNRHDFQIDNKAAGGKTKRMMTECVWTNF